MALETDTLVATARFPLGHGIGPTQEHSMLCSWNEKIILAKGAECSLLGSRAHSRLALLECRRSCTVVRPSDIPSNLRHLEPFKLRQHLPCGHLGCKLGVLCVNVLHFSPCAHRLLLLTNLTMPVDGYHFHLGLCRCARAAVLLQTGLLSVVSRLYVRISDEYLCHGPYARARYCSEHLATAAASVTRSRMAVARFT